MRSNETGNANVDLETNFPRSYFNSSHFLPPVADYLRRKMSKTDEQKIVEIIFSTEEVADTILVNKQELVELEKATVNNRSHPRNRKELCQQKESLDNDWQYVSKSASGDCIEIAKKWLVRVI